MKIKEASIRAWLIIIVGITFYGWLISPFIEGTQSISNISFKGLVIYLLLLIAVIFQLVSTIFGSYIEVENGDIIVAEGYLKKKYAIKQITKIYYKGHPFLGPILLMDYKEDGSIVLKKLLVLANYKKKGVRSLLTYLNDKYPEIKFDDFCEKVTAGQNPPQD